MQKKMTDRTPGSYDNRGLPRHSAHRRGAVLPADLLVRRAEPPRGRLSRSELVEARAKELGFWQGLTFRMERWLTDSKSELEAVGREEFRAASPRTTPPTGKKADAARAHFRDRRRRRCLQLHPRLPRERPIQNVSWLVRMGFCP